MGYCSCMGYEVFFPANQLSGLKNLWDSREYGVCEPWGMRELTVVDETAGAPTVKLGTYTHSDPPRAPMPEMAPLLDRMVIDMPSDMKEIRCHLEKKEILSLEI